MKKILIFAFCTFLAAVLLIYLWLRSPNPQEKATHIATFCTVVQRNPDFVTQAELLELLQFTYRNSTPSYALHPEKFYKNYAANIVKQYFKLSPAEKLQASQSQAQCRELIQP